MRYYDDLLDDTITYWAVTGKDVYGEPTFAAPIPINGRWSEKQEIFVDTDGEEKTSRAVVRLAQDVSLGGYLYHGTSAGLNPLNVTGAWAIRGWSKIKAISGDFWSRKAFL